MHELWNFVQEQETSGDMYIKCVNRMRLSGLSVCVPAGFFLDPSSVFSARGGESSANSPDVFPVRPHEDLVYGAGIRKEGLGCLFESCLLSNTSLDSFEAPFLVERFYFTVERPTFFLIISARPPSALVRAWTSGRTRNRAILPPGCHASLYAHARATRDE